MSRFFTLRLFVLPALAAGFLHSAPMMAQAHDQGTLSLSGRGEVSAAPDMATITMGVVSQAKTAAEALADNNARLSGVFTVLDAAGIEKQIADIVALGRTPYATGLRRLSADDTAAIDAALSQCGAAEFRGRRFGTLSGGEQARVHLARTLATQAPLLLVDEPVTALDPYYQHTVMAVLRDYAAAGHVVIAALHDLTLAGQYADQIWVMQNGSLVENAAPNIALRTEILTDVFRIQRGPSGFSAL